MDRILIIVMFYGFIILSSCNSCTGSSGSETGEPGNTNPDIDTIQVPQQNIPPLEVFFFDWDTRPPDDGTDITTYTSEVFVANNTSNTLYGPLRASTYPNSFSNNNNATPYNTVKILAHLFNNLSGHDGSAQKGLNLVDKINALERKSPAYHMNNPDTIAWYINIHKGFSNNGNYNSRGSHGCLTIHPDDRDTFFSYFDFSGTGGTTGASTGVVYVFREDANTRKQMIDDLQNQYP